MTSNTTKEIRPIEIAFDLDNITIGLGELTALLQLYDEHWENELTGVDHKEPCTTAILLARQELGLALLRAIEDKAARIKDLADFTAKRALQLARGTNAEVKDA